MENTDAFYDKLDQENAAPVIDHLMKTTFAEPPPGILVPKEAWKKSKREELKNTLSTKELRQRLHRGLEVILKELQGHVNGVERETIGEELSKVGDHLIAFMKEPSGTPSDNPESLQNLLKISDETMEGFYQCGVRLGQNKSHQEAADAFFFMTCLDYRRHNIWMALGLNEQILGHIEDALKAYSMAIITDIENPWSYLYAAQCYLSLGQKTDAKECLESALAHTDRLSKEQSTRFKTLAEKCRTALR